MRGWLWLLIGLAALAVVLAWAFGMWWQRRQPSGKAVDAGALSASLPSPIAAPMVRPAKVGNDSAARPWERYPASFAGDQLPAGFVMASPFAETLQQDEADFLADMRRLFVALQQAWDAGDGSRLQQMLALEMARAAIAQLAEREQNLASVQKTDIIVLEARLLDASHDDSMAQAQVEFSGVSHDGGAVASAPFREIWTLQQDRSQPQAPWRVAAVQSLE